MASPIDFGCIPYATNGNKGVCANLEDTISSALGEAYRALLASLQTKLSGATFLYVDLYNLTRTNSSTAAPLGELLCAFDELSNVRFGSKTGKCHRLRSSCGNAYLSPATADKSKIHKEVT